MRAGTMVTATKALFGGLTGKNLARDLTETSRALRRMNLRRVAMSLTLARFDHTQMLVASVGTAVAIAVSVLVPVPYVILGPGPTLNTLGKDSSGQPLITISGHPSSRRIGAPSWGCLSSVGCIS